MNIKNSQQTPPPPPASHRLPACLPACLPAMSSLQASFLPRNPPAALLHPTTHYLRPLAIPCSIHVKSEVNLWRRTFHSIGHTGVTCGRTPASKRNERSSECRAAVEDSPASKTEVFKGTYGPWSIDSNDIREVLLYRAGLVATAVAFVMAASRAFLPEDNPAKILIEEYSDILYATGAGGLGVSLLLIHIYVTPIKRTLQLLWAIGVLGSIVVALNLAAPADEGLVDYVLQNPWGVWLVGPLFAALTGLVFKEGLCYGKMEAGVLVFIIPALLLGHLSGALDEKLKLGLLLAWMILFTVFTARKFTQPIKDDLGDKSIFIFNALTEEEKNAVLSKMQEQTKRDGIEQGS